MTPLLALHGFTGRADAWAEAAPHAAGLAVAGHAPDLPVPAGWSFDHEADRIAAVAGAAGEPVHLAGYSMGGRLALAVACRWPERVARLTLVGVHPGLADQPAIDERRAADEGWCALLERGGIEAFVSAWQEQPLWRSQAALPAEVRERQRLARLQHSPVALAAALRALGLGSMPSLWRHLDDLPMPVDWVAGGLDERFIELARRAAARCRAGQLIVVAGAGHNVLLERPAEISRALGDARAERRST